MQQGDPIDVWFGIGDGESRKLKGEYVSEDLIRIVDSEFLEEVGFDSPWEYECLPLSENRWVSYDDFAWSPLGEIPESDLREGVLSPRHVEEKSFGGEVRFHKVFDL